MWNFKGNWAILALNVYGNFIGRPTGLAAASLILDVWYFYGLNNVINSPTIVDELVIGGCIEMVKGAISIPDYIILCTREELTSIGNENGKNSE